MEMGEGNEKCSVIKANWLGCRAKELEMNALAVHRDYPLRPISDFVPPKIPTDNGVVAFPKNYFLSLTIYSHVTTIPQFTYL